MNLRILKKLSKKAAILLPVMMPRHHNAKDWFLAEKGENYHGLKIEPPHGEAHRKRFPSDLERPHPLKATPMVGGMDCTDSPEWWEKTVWDVFQDVVWWANVDHRWSPEDDGTGYPPLRKGLVLKVPADYLREARRMVAEGRHA